LKLIRNYFVLFFVATIIVALDQWTKGLVRTNIAPNKVWLPEYLIWLAPYARIVHWYNRGAAFGLFQGGWLSNLIFSILVLTVVELIIYYFRHLPTQEKVLRFTMGFFLGGALGNLIDRLTLGHVTDFISVGRFPVFNVADSSITIGAAIFFLLMLQSDRDDISGAFSRWLASEKELGIWGFLRSIFFFAVTWVRDHVSNIAKSINQHRTVIISSLKSIFVLLISSGVIVLFDQWMKSSSQNVLIGGLPTENIVLEVLLLHVLELILFIFPQIPRQFYFVQIALVMVFAGSVSNLIDLLTYRELGLSSTNAIPNINIADLSFGIGAVMLLLGAWLLKSSWKQANDTVKAAGEITSE
jgi:signal peptidase II